jgi:hypothetical protein
VVWKQSVISIDRLSVALLHLRVLTVDDFRQAPEGCSVDVPRPPAL